MKIEVFFSNIKTANDAVKELQKAGFTDAYVDLNDHYVDERNTETNLPGTEMSPSLSGLVLESDSHVVDRSKTPLTASSPMVSGFGRFDEVADANCRVIVDASDNDTEKVKNLIKAIGGELDNPNVQIPKHLENRLHDEGVDNRDI